MSISHCLPTILRMLLDGAKAKGIPLSGWKMLIGGAILPQALAREALELGHLRRLWDVGDLSHLDALRSHAENE